MKIQHDGSSGSIDGYLSNGQIDTGKIQGSEIAISASASLSAVIIQRLLEGTLDLAVMYRPGQPPGLTVVHLFDERFVHRSSAGRTFTADRYAVESWFFAPSRFPERYVPILV